MQFKGALCSYEGVLTLNMVITKLSVASHNPNLLCVVSGVVAMQLKCSEWI